MTLLYSAAAVSHDSGTELTCTTLKLKMESAIIHIIIYWRAFVPVKMAD